MAENVFGKSKPKGDKEIMKGTIFRRLLTIVFLCLAAQIGVCAEDRAGEGELIRNMKTRMAEEGILFLREMDSGIAGIDPASGTLTIRDWNGKTTGTIRLSDCLDPVYECSGLLDCTDAADNGWAAVFSLNELFDHLIDNISVEKETDRTKRRFLSNLKTICEWTLEPFSGIRKGKIMFTNILTLPAPSTSAASISSAGTRFRLSDRISV